MTPREQAFPETTGQNLYELTETVLAFTGPAQVQARQDLNIEREGVDMESHPYQIWNFTIYFQKIHNISRFFSG